MTTGFTLSRVWKKKRSKAHSHGDVENGGAGVESHQLSQQVSKDEKSDPDCSSVV